MSAAAVRETGLAAELALRLLVPLAVGGEVRPLRPIGSARAQELADEPPGVVDPLWPELEASRLRTARSLAAVDQIAAIAPAEWLLAAALNDLLQATNPELVGPFSERRIARLLDMVETTLVSAATPATVAEALGRHATFAGAHDALRIDTEVRWWTGSATFRGSKPPRRLAAWPKLRRVERSETSVRLAEMGDALGPLEARWSDLLGRWVRASPLGDLATAGRSRPVFVWTESALGLIATPLGRALARRAVDRSPDVAAAATALGAALPSLHGAALGQAEGYVRDVEGLITEPASH